MSRSDRSSERGAMIIMVAVALLALTVVSGIVIDQGILWSAREQAQNVADAAALTGALARTWNDTNANPSKTSGVIYEQVQAVAARQTVLGSTLPSSAVTPDWTCPPGSGGPTECVVVDVYRDGTHGSTTMSTSFLSLVGVTNQTARAHAVAWPAGSNISDCLRPWFVLNKPGVGYTTNDIGSELILDSRVTPSGFGKIDVGSGESAVVASVHGCAPGGSFHVGETVGTQTGAAGNPTVNAVEDVIDWDPSAHYDSTTKTIQGSCAPNCNCSPYVCPNAGKGMSPRVFIAPICAPVGDPGCVSGGNGSTHEITIIGFLSFFINSAQAHGNDIEIH